MKRGMTKFFPWARTEECQRKKVESTLKAISWEPTRACNLNCRHCALACTPYEVAARTVDPYVVMDTFSALAECCNPQETFICINGGEPLLYPYLFLVTRHLHDLGFDWGMMTNGTLVSRDLVPRCRDAGMRSISVSVDGTKREHDMVRGLGTYDRAIRALNYFRKADFLDLIQVTTCVGGHNVSALKDMSSVFSEMGIEQWRLVRMQCEGRAAENEEFVLSARDREYLMDFVELESLTEGRPEIIFAGDDYQGADFAVMPAEKERTERESALARSWKDLESASVSRVPMEGLIPCEASTEMATSMLPGNSKKRQ
ncbi:radical SAM protein [Candidatus Hydrogenedentota bacterium]